MLLRLESMNKNCWKTINNSLEISIKRKENLHLVISPQKDLDLTNCAALSKYCWKRLEKHIRDINAEKKEREFQQLVKIQSRSLKQTNQLVLILLSSLATHISEYMSLKKNE